MLATINPQHRRLYRQPHPPSHKAIVPTPSHSSLITNNITSIYRIHNNPNFENTDYTETHAQQGTKIKRRCKLLDVTHCLPSLSRAPLCTTHIQQELWTYKKGKAFSMTPTEAIRTLYNDDLDVHHIDDWKISTFATKGVETMAPRKTGAIPHALRSYEFRKMGSAPIHGSWIGAKSQSSCCSH